ncbi:class I SAM-dependent methyltransferase [Aliivibrio sp.]|uniref:class I SAM-dependent methyltransferase n=1 Tax=Aliivibrio sp. TaxID=1872443 RepID=UPI003D2F1562
MDLNSDTMKADATIEPQFSLERIYPNQIDKAIISNQDVLDIHLERYEFASKNLQGRRILDIACGCGYGTALMAAQHPGKQFLGVDIDPAAVEYARNNYQANNLRYLCGDGCSFTEPSEIDNKNQLFDTIISLETIEHVPYPQQMVSHLLTQLSSNGSMIASVPTTPTVDGNPHHLHDFTVKSFYQLFSVSGFTAVEKLEQIQKWDFSGIFSAKKSQENRSQGVARNVIKHYLSTPSALFFRVHAIITQGLCNRYLTAQFKK